MMKKSVFFIKGMILPLIVGVIVSFCASMVSHELLRNMVVNGEANAASHIVNNIYKVNQLYDDPMQIKNRAEMYMSLICDRKSGSALGLEGASMVVNRDTGEVVYDSDYAVYTIVNVSEEEKLCLKCTDPAVVEFMSSFDKPEEYDEIDSGKFMYSYDVSGVYYNDKGEFIPEKVTVSMVDGSTEQMICELETMEYSSPEGDWTYTTDNNMFLSMGTYDDSVVRTALTKWIDCDRNGTPKYAYDDVYGEYIHQQFNLLIDGVEYDVYYLSKADIWGVNARFIVAGCAVTMALAILVGLFVTLVRWNKYSSRIRMEEYRRNMTNTLAHDLKSPLMAVSGYAENMQADINTEKREHYLNAILDNVDYMNGIITDVLELSSLENTRRIERTPADLVELSRELCGKHTALAQEHGISFEISGECAVSADRTMISRALDNLLNNALKFSPDGGAVKVTGTSTGLTVVNTMSAESAAGLADGDVTAEQTKPFAKADTARTGKRGSGLGLTIVKNILDIHGYKLILTKAADTFTAQIKV